MFAIVRYTAQHDGAVRDYEVKKVFEPSATYEACEEYLLKNKPRKNERVKWRCVVPQQQGDRHNRLDAC